jgi:hypothetical protein
MRFIIYYVNLIFNLVNDFEEKNIQECLETRMSLIFECLKVLSSYFFKQNHKKTNVL